MSAKISGDNIARIVVVILITLFLGVTAYSMLAPKKAPPAAMRGAATAGGTATGAQPSGSIAKPDSSPRNSGGAATGGSGSKPDSSQAARSATQTGNAQAKAANAITVSAKTLAPETIRQLVKLNGDVASQSEVNVLPDTSGRVTRIVLRLGRSVKRGDVIAYIDPSRPGSSYAQNPVIAPVSGTITNLPITAGETVSTSTVIASIGALNNLKVTIYVAEKYSAYLKRALPAFVSFSATPDEEFEAEVTELSPVVNNKNRTIETTLTLKTQDSRIKPGMFASVRLVIREEKNALVVPRTAIKDYAGSDVVYIIATGGIAKRVPVRIGLRNDTDVQISGGLEPGQRVITGGAVTDGSPVREAPAVAKE